MTVSSGFETTEYGAPRKLLEAAGYRVFVGGPSLEQITGLDGATKVKPSLILTEANPADYDAIIFVGSLDNPLYYTRSEEVHDLIHRALDENIVVAAICNGVRILVEAGILEGKNATMVNPADTCSILEANGATCTKARVERDGNIITAGGPPTSREFGETILQTLLEEKAIEASGVQPIRITYLYDNTSFDTRLTSDWGFSALIETGEHSILFDTGHNGEILKGNAEILGIDLTEVDIVVLSHEHLDHIGGLDEVLDLGITPPVYAPESFPENIKNSIRAKTDLVTVSEHIEIVPGIYSTGQLGSTIPEQGLIIQTEQGVVLITGCAHPGILSMVRKTKSLFDDDIAWVMGGFHLGGMAADSVRDIAGLFRGMDVGKITPAHCTGEEQIQVFASFYDEDYVEGGAGHMYEIPLDTESSDTTSITDPSVFQISSPAFGDGEVIPVTYTCDDKDISPPLEWGEPPDGTASLVLVVEDLSADDNLTHWLLFNIPPDTRSLPEGVPPSAHFDDGSQHGTNNRLALGYMGPCPPPKSHQYRFRLYALDTTLDLEDGVMKIPLKQAIRGKALAETEIIGIYYP